ncbi:NAD(P)-dependent oxidoreductase [Ramlibacter sp.]|uniref:NAD-dependent epimerase/dehydratase family protein n=1 Tax=Ramlibacter sp. TaxID=1917967 RepID=UPI002632096F|nr:NAD(P)-dependent oxidoreductase [Ramlibacter sp.]MDB5957085.1 NAD(P)-dependent oxidoreductase [Ramlibacter sp.]
MKLLVTGGSGFIGTHLVEYLLARGHEVLNLDIAAPNLPTHEAAWREVDIMDAPRVLAAFEQFQPEVVVHLAARTDTDSNRLSDYEVNTVGTERILAGIRHVASVKRFVLTSTQFVNQYNGLPKGDQDYAPHTVYGESKVIAEQVTRAANLPCTWVIIRPTNIWGAWHRRYPSEFWAILSRKLYLHPGFKPVTRAYGYVGNVVQQVAALIDAPAEKVNGQVFYVGDEPIDLYQWVNGFSMAQIGSPVRRVPRAFIRGLALVGDAFKLVHLKFPITGSRYKSMTHSNYISIKKTTDVCGVPPYSLSDGIRETVEWMQTVHPALVRASGRVQEQR